MSDCAFCRIATGEAAAKIVFKDERTLSLAEVAERIRAAR